MGGKRPPAMRQLAEFVLRFIDRLKQGACLLSDVGCTAQPHHNARETIESLIFQVEFPHQLNRTCCLGASSVQVERISLSLPRSDACWLAPGMDALLVSRACLSPSTRLRPGSASWPVFCLASNLLTLASLGVNGFGSFCRNKRTSAVGPNPDKCQ